MERPACSFDWNLNAQSGIDLGDTLRLYQCLSWKAGTWKLKTGTELHKHHHIHAKQVCNSLSSLNQHIKNSLPSASNNFFPCVIYSWWNWWVGNPIHINDIIISNHLNSHTWYFCVLLSVLYFNIIYLYFPVYSHT